MDNAWDGFEVYPIASTDIFNDSAPIYLHLGIRHACGNGDRWSVSFEREPTNAIALSRVMADVEDHFRRCSARRSADG